MAMIVCLETLCIGADCKSYTQVDWGTNATADNGKGGYVEPPGYGDHGKDVKRDCNESRTLGIHPYSGYQVTKATLYNASTGNLITLLPSDLVNAGTYYTYTFNVGYKVNWEFNVYFSVLSTGYTITASAGANGAISPSGSVSVSDGANESFSITPNSGYVISDVVVDGSSQGAISSYTFSSIHANHSIAASFVAASQAITATAGANGSISPAGTVSVVYNSDQTFTITPNSGYVILDVKVDGVSKGPLNSYTFNDVTTNHTIAATFALSITTIDTYTQIPPFVASASNLKPNVLFIVDNSGSMDSSAYSSDTYTSTKTYYGYFDTNKMYLSSSSTYTVDNTKTLDLTQKTSGNYLNWKYMTRMDVIRKALIGGKVENRSANPMYLVSTNNVKINIGSTAPTGIVQALAGKVRFGVMFFNDSGTKYEDGSGKDGGYIGSLIGASASDIVTQVESKDPSTWTPLSETLYEAIRYFSKTTSAYNTGVTYSGSDPIEYACQKNFVIVLTDGEPTMDRNVPGTKFTYTGRTAVTDSNFNIKTWMDTIATNEGYTSQWSSDPGSSGSYYLEGVAYYAHNTDLRADLSGKQNLTIYTVYAFGSGSTARDILQKAAKYGGYEDKNNDGIPNQASEWNKTGDGVPDTYFEAAEGDSLESSLLDTLTSILAKVSSGTAASILSNSEGSGANIIQAVFYPNKIYEKQTEVNWVGEMQNLWYYLDPYIGNSTVREDTDYIDGAYDHKLHLINDYVARFFFDGTQTNVELSKDTNGDGSGNTVVSTVNPDDVKSIWKAGSLLWSRTSARTMYTTCINDSAVSNGLCIGTSPEAGKSLMSFDSASAATLRPYLQAADDTQAGMIVDYIRGTDQTGYRNRRVTRLTAPGVYTTNEWKLGDIISSTPRIQSTGRLNTYDLDPPSGYADTTYKTYVESTNYKNRGMVYVGGNDGMLHAFKLGKLDVSASGFQKAKLSGTNLGREEWTFLPKGVLPFLKYYTDPKYNHLYYVDGTTTLLDASVNCSDTDYWNCSKTSSSWRTILLGGMGTGGASRITGSACSECVKTPITDPDDASKGFGYSSYFALDISDQYYSSDTLVGTPKLMWEFFDPALGYSTTGPAIIRTSARTTSSGVEVPDTSKNGRWFAVFASGPTGPIDPALHQFKGRSDQNLQLFIVDLKTGPNCNTLAGEQCVWKLDTGLPNAFAGSLSTAVIDADRWSKTSRGRYQDDAIYIGYVQANGNPITTSTTWTNGGVLRLFTHQDPNPANWTLSTVISGVGPVTTSVTKLQDRKYHKLWLYFGTGRYYHAQDDTSSQRRLFGVMEKCYTILDTLDPTALDASNNACTDVLTISDLADKTTSPADALTSSQKGWYITLDAEDTANTLGAERVITDPVAMTNGVVFFTSFVPTSDICSFGGNSYMWAVKYNTGYEAPDSALQGKALVQVSTGSFEEVNLSTAFTDKYNRRTGTPMVGKPPSDSPPIVSKSNLKPVKKIIHIQEK